MLRPSRSTLLLVDSTDPKEIIMKTPIQPLKIIVEAGKYLRVSFVTAHSSQLTAQIRALQILGLDSGSSIFSFDPTSTNWPSTELGRTLAQSDRDQIVLAGLWLEEAITIVALGCLAFGFDTYIAENAAIPLDRRHARTALARLYQAGAVPTTAEQVVGEWAVFSEGNQSRNDLLALTSR
jgi:hypothetical protein